MNIIVGDKPYKLSELAKAATTSDGDLIYLVQMVNGEPVSIAVEKSVLLAGILPTGSSIISGGATYTGTGLIFDVSTVLYQVDGTIFEIAPTQITLPAADPTDPRFDAIVVDTNTNAIDVVSGTPAASPTFPILGIGQLLLQPVLVAAAATTPTVTTTEVYKEDVEWTTSVVDVNGTAAGTIDFTDTTDPYEGTVNIQMDANNSRVAKFAAGATQNFSDFANVSVRIYLTTPIPAGKSIQLIALTGNSAVGQVSLTAQGLNSTLVDEWQLVSFNASAFNAGSFDGFALRYTGAAQYAFRVDNLLLQSGQQVIVEQDITIQKNGATVGSTSELDFVEGTNVTLGIVQNPNGSISITVNSSGGGGGGGQVDSVVGTTNEIDVDSSDPENPIVSLASEVTDSLDLADTALQSGNNVSELNNDTGFITESDATDTLRSFSKPQWLDVAALTAVSDVFTPDLGVSGSFTADIGANSTLANPTIPVGYDTGKVLAWDITFTITGAGGWTLAFGNQYFVDADVDIATIISDNSTTGDVIQLFFQFKNNKISVQPFIPTAIP